METFRIPVEIENPERRGERRRFDSVLVDTGAELPWFPAPALESLGVERRKSPPQPDASCRAAALPCGFQQPCATPFQVSVAPPTSEH